jgi:sugar phosphate isomerase/epimerase
MRLRRSGETEGGLFGRAGGADNRGVEIALMTASMLDRPWEAALDAAVAQGVRWIEACGGGHIPTLHFDPVLLDSDREQLKRFTASLEERELRLSAFACHGNPLHPDRRRAESDHEALAATCRLAAQLGVRHVNLLAGLPAGGPGDSTPNWIVNSLFPGLDDVYRWQWEECALPYWRGAAALAADAGVVLCLEPHPADMVYNPPTFTHLREEVGPAIAMNLDPSHLWWQGIDPLSVVDELGDQIGTCHVKDVHFDQARIAREGVLSATAHERWDERPWAFSTPGYGNSEHFWSRFVMALRRVGYSGTLSIECEDPFLTPDDTFAASVALLRRVLPTQPPPAVDWAATVAFSDAGREAS